MFTPQEQEQFFAEELNRIKLRQKKEKQDIDLKIKERVEKELVEEEKQKRIWWKVSFLRKFSEVGAAVQTNFLKQKASDNLAQQISLSHLEYVGPAAVVGAAARGVATGAARAVGVGVGEATAGGGAAVGSGVGGIEAAGGRLGGFGSGAGENLGRYFRRIGRGIQTSEEEGEEEEKEEDFQKVQAAGKMAQAAKADEEKKLQRQRALARMQKLAQQVKQIKMALHAVKIGSILTSLGSLGLTLLVTILTWIGQFIGRYILGIKVIPGYDWLDYLLMAFVVLLLALILAPILVVMATICEVDIFGIVC